MGLRACKHYRKRFGDETYIVQSYGLPWNAWVEVYEGDRLVYSTHVTGLFSEYLQHLLENPECREEVGISEKAVKELLREIEETWRVYVR